MLLSLLIALTSCISQRNRVITHTVYPDFEYIPVPDPYRMDESVVTLDDNDVVSMPLYYWLEIVDYCIDTQNLQEYLQGGAYDSK